MSSLRCDRTTERNKRLQLIFYTFLNITFAPSFQYYTKPIKPSNHQTLQTLQTLQTIKPIKPIKPSNPSNHQTIFQP